jgi:hypothetical protein
MEFGIDRAIYNAGLEAGVCIAKGYRRCHGNINKPTVSAAKRQQELSLIVCIRDRSAPLARDHPP